LVSDIKGRTYTDGIRVQGSQESIWAKRDEIIGGWSKLHNKELHDLYSSPNIVRMLKSRRMRWAGYVARIGEKKNTHGVLMEKPKGKEQLGRSKHRWENNMRMGWYGSV
jgi:hypothetical protein